MYTSFCLSVSLYSESKQTKEHNIKFTTHLLEIGIHKNRENQENQKHEHEKTKKHKIEKWWFLLQIREI